MPIPHNFTAGGRSLVRDILIETGTYRGETVAAALAAGFREVHSVETDVTLYLEALVRFRGDHRVRLHHGTSPDVLAVLLGPDLTRRPALVYLDGHFMGPEHGLARDGRYGECPLLAELDRVAAPHWGVRPVVVVDDAHMLRRPWGGDLPARFVERDWPTLAEVTARLPGYEFVETEYELYCFPTG